MAKVGRKPLPEGTQRKKCMIYLEPDLLREIKTLAEKNNRSMSAEAVWLIQAALARGIE